MAILDTSIWKASSASGEQENMDVEEDNVLAEILEALVLLSRTQLQHPADMPCMRMSLRYTNIQYFRKDTDHRL